MAEKDTYVLLFGLAVLMGMGFLFWKLSAPPSTLMGSASQNTITEFVRDDKGRVIQIIERKT